MITTTLAYFPSPSQGVWHVGPIPLRAYALCIIAGIIVALVIGDRRWAARGGERGVIYDIALWAVPFGLIGGRMYHVMTDWKTYFGEGGAGLAAAFKIWDGGLGIWGAVALGAVGAWIGCRRRGIPLPAFGDAIAPGIVLAQAIGRLGNYFNQELYGRETTVPWGMEVFYRRDPTGIIDVHSLNGVSTGQVAAVVHPTFLYELLWNVLVFVALIYLDRRFKIGHGRLFALYVAGYCVGRFCVELMRDDFATHIAGVRINSFTATFVFIGAIVYFILAPKGREDPATLGGAEEAQERADSDAEVPELAKDLAAVAATSGVVAAATVASREDDDEDISSSGGDAETLAADADDELAGDADDGEVAEDETLLEAEVAATGVETESAAVAEDADDGEAAEDETLLEAEVAATGVETESAAVAEDADLIDEDHDPVDEEDLESLSDDVALVGGPVSEQQEELESGDDETLDEESAEADVDVDDEPAAEQLTEAELDADEPAVSADEGAPEETEAAESAADEESAEEGAGAAESDAETVAAGSSADDDAPGEGSDSAEPVAEVTESAEPSADDEAQQENADAEDPAKAETPAPATPAQAEEPTRGRLSRLLRRRG